MNTDSRRGKVWNIFITNYKERVYHGLSVEEIEGIVQEEWEREFNGIDVGSDVGCLGHLMVFFQGDNAYVAYEDIGTREWRCSYDLEACDRPDWEQMVRLTPSDTHDYSFRRCSLVSKECARQIVKRFIQSGDLKDLYLTDANGKPVIEPK